MFIARNDLRDTGLCTVTRVPLQVYTPYVRTPPREPRWFNSSGRTAWSQSVGELSRSFMMILRNLWNCLASLIGLVRMSAKLSAVAT